MDIQKYVLSLSTGRLHRFNCPLVYYLQYIQVCTTVCRYSLSQFMLASRFIDVSVLCKT